MGFHVCKMCFPGGFNHPGGPSNQDVNAMAFSPYSSQDVRLEFTNGHYYEFPHGGLLHYVTQHNYLPPESFVNDVMNGDLKGGEVFWTKGVRLPPTKIGYLRDENDPAYREGYVPDGFVERLLALIDEAENSPNGHSRVQTTRGG